MRAGIQNFSLILGVLAAWAQQSAEAAENVDFNRQIKPILESRCLSCHNPNKSEGELSLDTRAAAVKGGDYGPAIVAGKPDESSLYTLTILDADDDDIMPPKGDPLSKDQTELLRLWIEQGAEWAPEIVLEQAQLVDFVTDVQPLLELNCLSCHREDYAKGDLRLDTQSTTFTGGKSGRGVLPGKSSASLVYTSTILPEDHDDLMPPTKKGGPLSKSKTDILKLWIDQGALWPDGVTLVPRKEGDDPGVDMELINNIHARLVENNQVTTEDQMQPYTERLGGTQVTFEMVPIPGGEFTMGSPAGERNRGDDEGPQIQVKISPFWMGKHEVTWNEYELFMYPEEMKMLATGNADEYSDPLADAVTKPTKPYVEMSFGMGKDGYPAISMTQHAANMYCHWLSAKTGHFYRLPTEAEWEYACRAGTTTAYSFGDDPDQLDAYAWYADNSDFKYQKVGKKKPNPWGLYDMHGNVTEWVIDQYFPDSYSKIGASPVDPWLEATTLYPRGARGGSWDDDPERLRSAARRASSEMWKMQDPQLPKSIWYHTDAQFLGLRVVRPLEIASPEELSKYWTRGVERD